MRLRRLPMNWLESAAKRATPEIILSYPLDLDERSRFEREDGQLLIIIQTRYRLPEDSDIPYDTAPLGILHTDDCLVTVVP